MSDNTRERDLVLAPNEFAFILDETKGHVIAYTGPHKTSLANTDRPVSFDESSRRFRRCTLEEAIRQFPYAEEGWYVVLENPRDGDEEHPKSGPNTTPKLTWGRKINIPGPITFPLWPGQEAQVVQGHHLRSNQYLVVKVYNEEAARDNWTRAVIKPQKEGAEAEVLDSASLTLGQLLVIRGTEVSFYIPPTGVEVLACEGSYIREAVTLERLEYCILLDEDGNKRYIEGPDVVFPNPTERFVERHGHRKFKAIELNEISGLYIKVIAPYQDETGVQRKVGEELFLTGRDQMIYFPRPEHALIRYGEQQGEVHYAVAIPAGQARYVLDRLTGDISVKQGPCMFLPDPRKEVLVRRILTSQECHLFFPGNQEVLHYNSRLRGEQQQLPTAKKAEASAAPAPRAERESVGASHIGDDFTRSQRFTPPRSITLDQRFEGAVNLNIWTGYAVQVVSRTGSRRVLVGPACLTLEYNETLEAMELSCGTPKSEDHTIKTVYLRILNNQVSDLISAETRDLCQVSVQVSYRVSFEGDPNRWFNVENYVKFLTDHLRSVVRNAVKQRGLEEFHNRAIDIVRDSVLGAPGTDGNPRPGRFFEANGMRVYDVDVLDISIGDDAISQIFTAAQHHVVRDAILLAQEEQKLQATKRSQQIQQAIAQATFETRFKELQLQQEECLQAATLEKTRIESEGRAKIEKLTQQQGEQDLHNSIQSAELSRLRQAKDQELELNQRRLEQQLAQLKAEVQAVVDKAEAISPDLIAALQAFGDRELAGKMAQSMAPLAILGGSSISDVLAKLLAGTNLEGALLRKPLPDKTSGNAT